MKKVKKLYYLVWVDAIQSFQKHHPNSRNWKLTLFVFITYMHSLNFWIFAFWIKYFKIYDVPEFKIDFLPGELLNSSATFLFTFAMPFAIVNYSLIFHKNRYKKILNNYGIVRNKYALSYSLCMIFGAFISAILYGVLP